MLQTEQQLQQAIIDDKMYTDGTIVRGNEGQGSVQARWPPVSEIKVRTSLCDDVGVLATGKLTELRNVQRNFDERLQQLLSIVQDLVLVVLIAVDVHADGGSRAAGPAQTVDDPRPVLKDHPDSLFLGDAVVNGVSVLEVVDLCDLVSLAGVGVGFTLGRWICYELLQV